MHAKCLKNCFNKSFFNSVGFLATLCIGMAPKRQRVEGSSSRASRNYDRTHIVSEAASERFNSSLVNNNLI